MLASRMTPAFVLTLAALLLAFGPAPARADLVLIVENSTAPVGGTGSFDVLLLSTLETFGVGGFSVELSVPAASGVTFTAVDTNTTAALYLFGTLQSPPFSFSTFPTTDFIASDLDASAPGFVNVTPAGPFGLEHVTYSVTPGSAPGPVTVSIVGLSGGAPTTLISDVGGGAIPFTPVNGTITITAVPEPSSLWLMSVALIGASLKTLARRGIPRRFRRVED
jgi:PEP-CTERM motif